MSRVFISHHKPITSRYRDHCTPRRIPYASTVVIYLSGSFSKLTLQPSQQK